MTVADIFGNATISALVGGLTGWIATYRTQRSFGRQTKRDEISDLCSELRADGAIYWQKAGQDPELERSILRLSMRCRGKCLRYNQTFLRGSRTSEVKVRAQTLHNALSDGAFQTATRVPEPARIDRIKTSIDQLEATIGN